MVTNCVEYPRSAFAFDHWDSGRADRRAARKSRSLEDAFIATLIAYVAIAGAFFAIDAYAVL